MTTARARPPGSGDAQARVRHRRSAALTALVLLVVAVVGAVVDRGDRVPARSADGRFRPARGAARVARGGAPRRRPLDEPRDRRPPDRRCAGGDRRRRSARRHRRGRCAGAGAARAAFTVTVELPTAVPPHKAVVFWNPKSGGGKAEQANLASEARKRGIEPVELQLGDDLAELVHRAVADGADPSPPRAGTARRRSSPPRRPSTACRTPVSPRARATTSRSISASTETTSSAPSTHS